LDLFGGLHHEAFTFEDVAYSLVGNRIEELMIERNRYNNFMNQHAGRVYRKGYIMLKRILSE
jgi:hypothetical protein